MKEQIKNFKIESEKKIEQLINEFFYFNPKKDWEILRINLHNIENEITWFLIEKELKETFKNKQQLLKIGNITFDPEKYPLNTKFVYDIDQNKKFMLTPEKKEKLLEENYDFSNLEEIAERKRIPYVGPIWEITCEKEILKLEEQMIAIKLSGEYLKAYEYPVHTIISKNKQTNIKKLSNIKGQVVMKK